MKKVSLLTFFIMWADRMRWEVPDIHIQALYWLEHKQNLAVLRCFRGFGKSTILAIYNAWRYYKDPTYRILHQSESDKTAYKTSRDTQHVLKNHPLTQGMFRDGGIEQWWVEGATDTRNASMYCKGILSNVTSARADEAQNDDVEVPKNIGNPESREKLRYRLGEQVHILVPGSSRLFIGTPHTHDSIYDEMQKMGADCLTIKMFAKEQRVDSAERTGYQVAFIPDFVFSGIGKDSRLLEEGVDYTIKGNVVTLNIAEGTLVDFYGECAWPERFDRQELTLRRKQTRTINEWDSQYQLHSKPIGDVRLNPERMIPYDLEPVIKTVNKTVVMTLGSVQIVGASARWDCSLGKIKSDTSAFSLVLTDARGRLYWQFAEALVGEVDAQCRKVKELVLKYRIPGVTVETNGPGGFVPPILRKHLAGTGCAVIEDFASSNKNKDILDAFEAPLSNQFLWAHVSVLDGPAYGEMRDFNPAITNQPDGYIDSAGRAIKSTPVRIGNIVGNLTREPTDNWRPGSQVHEVIVEN